MNGEATIRPIIANPLLRQDVIDMKFAFGFLRERGMLRAGGLITIVGAVLTLRTQRGGKAGGATL